MDGICAAQRWGRARQKTPYPTTSTLASAASGQTIASAASFRTPLVSSKHRYVASRSLAYDTPIATLPLLRTQTPILQFSNTFPTIVMPPTCSDAPVAE